MDTRQDINTALLVMDLHAGILHRMEEKVAQALIARIRQAIAASRKAGIPIIYVAVAFRKGFPEISPNNRSFDALKQNSANLSAMEEPVSFTPDIAPQPGDVLVTKRRISAFTGSDLEVMLRAYKVQHLVLTGVSTSGVVLSTLREAADKDFRLTVLSDGCADADPEVHTVLLSKVFPRQAEVLTIGQWIEQLQ